MLRLSLFLLVLLFPPLLFADNPVPVPDMTSEYIATVEKLNGSARLLREGELRKRKVSEGDKLIAGDIVSTSPSGQLRLAMFDDSVITIGHQSSVRLLSRNEVEQSEGKVYYRVHPRGEKQKLSVITDFVLIGVKGTTFLITANDGDNSVALQEGSLDMRSLGEEFELYRVEDKKAWDDYRQKMDTDFDEFKKAQQPEDQQAEFVKEFELKAGHTVSFDGNKTVEALFDDTLMEELKAFEMF